MREIIMGYQGEMSLKGLNRNQFESAMMKILRYRLKTVGKFKVYCTQSTFYMEPEEEDVDMDLAFDRVRTVFGLAALSRAVVCEKDFDTICRTAEEYLGDSLHGIKTFKVEARRSDKTYPMTSPELMRELGAYLLGLHNYLRVDVKKPQFKVIVEIRDYGAYIHGPKIPGEGGLPVGTSGRALNMLSGGIDSPVAAYRMAKRGLALDHIHFASPPYTSERAKLKVKALAQKITPYTGSSNLFVVPYTKPQEYIRDNAPDVLFTVLMRRSMMRIANRIATRQGCEALITGESLAQVASQTVKALQCTDAAQDLQYHADADVSGHAEQPLVVGAAEADGHGGVGPQAEGNGTQDAQDQRLQGKGRAVEHNVHVVVLDHGVDDVPQLPPQFAHEADVEGRDAAGQDDNKDRGGKPHGGDDELAPHLLVDAYRQGHHDVALVL